jgi:hypothetical protein
MRFYFNCLLLFICAALFASCGNRPTVQNLSDNPAPAIEVPVIEVPVIEAPVIENPADLLYSVYFPNKKMGMVNVKGELVVPAEYDFSSGFSEGLAGLSSVDRQESFYINTRGQKVFELDYNENKYPSRFSHGLARVKKNDLFGYINRKGSIVIDPTYVEASDFSEGLAAVKVGDELGFIDTEGMIVIPLGKIPLKSGFFRLEFQDGLFGYYHDNTYYNKEGEVALKTNFDSNAPFSSGLARVVKGNKLLYIDISGTVKLTPDISRGLIISDFVNGYAMIRTRSDIYGFIDKEGKSIIDPVYISASDFFPQGYAIARSKKISNVWGDIIIIDTSGRVLFDIDLTSLLSTTESPNEISISTIPSSVKLEVARFFGISSSAIQSITGTGQSVAGGNQELWKGTVKFDAGGGNIQTLNYAVSIDK